MIVLLVACGAILKDLNNGYPVPSSAFKTENRPIVDAILASIKAAYPDFEVDEGSLESRAIPELSRIMEESYGSTDVRGVHYSEHTRLFIKGQRRVYLGLNCSEYPNGICVQVSVCFRIKDEGIEIISAHTGMHEWAARSWRPDPPYRFPKQPLHPS